VRLRELPLRVESVRYERLERMVATRAFNRVTTVVRLRGAGLEGAGEDVALTPEDHDRWTGSAEMEARLRPPGTLGRALDAVGDADLWAAPGSGELARRQRRWAFESAALDLALRQAGVGFSDAVARRPCPVQFVASFRLGSPPSFERVCERLKWYPELRLKLDPTSDWEPELFEAIAATGSVDIVDLKGAYRGTMVDQEPDPLLYRRTVEAFPNALIEDPAVTDATALVLAPHRGRVAWDAPVHGVDDIATLPILAAAINVKPSRIGALGAVLDLYARCEQLAIPVYGGGQFELGIGRRQLQCLAACFHPNAPNDVAPTEYHQPGPEERLPRSPLALPGTVGFG